MVGLHSQSLVSRHAFSRRPDTENVAALKWNKVAVGMTVVSPHPAFLGPLAGAHRAAGNRHRRQVPHPIVLPLLPNEPVTALTTVTPYQARLTLLAVCTLSFASYLLSRYWRPDRATLYEVTLSHHLVSITAAIALAVGVTGVLIHFVDPHNAFDMVPLQ